LKKKKEEEVQKMKEEGKGMKEELPGPRMAASMSVTFSSFRKTLMPSGGVWTRSCSSMVIRLITFGERFSSEDCSFAPLKKKKKKKRKKKRDSIRSYTHQKRRRKQ
jgi:hypothetical protein